jgi:hypothetical protein
MKTVITKAIQKAQSRGMTPNETAELVMDYLEIAGEIAPAASQAPVKPSPETVRQVQAAIQTQDTPSSALSVSAPTPVGRVLNKAVDPNEPFWIAEDLYSEMAKISWEFSALPDGFKEPLEYKGMAVLRPRGIDGVAIVFTCPAVATPKEFPAFLSLNDKVIDPVAITEEVRRNVENTFRVRSTPIVNHNKPLTSFPSMADMAGGGAMFGGEV